MRGEAEGVIIAGTKATWADLAMVGNEGWDYEIIAAWRTGANIVGLCGGFQMLGKTITDPLGVEGKPGSDDGIGLIDIDTELRKDKRVETVTGRCRFADAPVSGYEIHMGVSTGSALAHPAFEIDGQAEGARSADDQIMGTYLHGFMDTPAACHAILSWAGLHSEKLIDLGQIRENSLDRVADMTLPLKQKIELLAPFF